VDYINANKAAWEEAFEHRYDNWGNDNYKKLISEELPFLNADVISKLKNIDLKGKTIAQFCCNNGRELLSATQLGCEYAYGFDIAENIIAQAKDTAAKAGIANCDFIAVNILEIDESFYGMFDFIFFTIGALTWFKNLSLLFEKVSKCLRPGGIMLINDYHPLMNMLAVPGEDAFDETVPDKMAYPYFKNDPWTEQDGMSYMSPKYKSKTFTSFSHTLSGIINSSVNAGMDIKSFDEYDYDVGLSDIFDYKGYPLSYILIAQKR